MSLKADIFKKEKQKQTHRHSKEEKEKLDHVESRFEAMKNNRQQVDQYWSKYQHMIDARYEPYPDERSASDVPLADALVSQYTAEAIKLKPIRKFTSDSNNKTAGRAVEHVWEYDWRVNNRDREIVQNEQITGAYGTSVIYTGYEQFEYTQKDPIIDDMWEFTFEDVTIQEKNIILKNADIRCFYPDNEALNDFSEANDCCYIQYMSHETFKQRARNPMYKNVDNVIPSALMNEYKPFLVEEEYAKQGDFVKLLCYWNKVKDAYIEVANGIIVREHPMVSTIDWRKALPFVMRVLGKKNYSLWGRGLAEACMMFNSEINNLRELLMDAIRRSNSQVLAIGWNLSFNGREFSYDNEILTFDWDLTKNFQQLSGNPPNNAIFSYIDRVYRDIAVYTGIDIQNIVGEPQQTAFQTEVQREASQKRINLWLYNRDRSFERLANLHKDNLKKFFPQKTAEWVFPQIEIEWEKFDGRKSGFKKRKWKHMFEVTPEVLRWDVKVDVHTNTNKPTIDVVEKQLQMDFVNSVANLANGYATAKQLWYDLNKKLPLEKVVEHFADNYSLPVINDPDVEWKKELYKEMRKSLQWMKTLPNQASWDMWSTPTPNDPSQSAQQQMML